MLYRKIEGFIERHLSSDDDKILVVEGARQIGKSFIIRHVASRMYKNFIEINFIKDNEGQRLFKNVRTVSDFYLVLSSLFKDKLGNYEDTIIFLDEIQEYPQYLTWLKFLREDKLYRFVASGSMLGISFRRTTSIPIGSIVIKKMYQLDFEEFMMANGVGDDVLDYMRSQYEKREELIEPLHDRILDLFKRYLLVGGLPEAVNTYLNTHNIASVRQVQTDIHSMYKADAVKYENDFGKKLLVKRIYEMIPSQMENKKKRIIAKEIRDKKGDRMDNYREEFEYLLSSGIALGTNAITNPRYPVTESVKKNLIKLYLNDVGLLTNILYRLNLKPVLDTECSVNLGSVYENVVAQQLKTEGYDLFYYDQRKVGEVDFLIDDYSDISPLPIEVKSGKDYTEHSALNRLLSIEDYGIKKGVVLSNERRVKKNGKILYLPIYYSIYLGQTILTPDSLLF